ncbi:MAG: tetratricopeptide repeat protein, partial [Proteobacteria bacterium]|nr:tetratricopeptide repeat protein [Pseudomonadota bacterium]
AEAAYRRALAIREKRFGPDSAEAAVSLQNLGVHLDQDGDYAQSIALLERAEANRAHIYGAEHPLTAISMLALADACDGNKQAQRALDLAEHALAIFRRSLPEEHQKISEALNMLASFQYERGDLAGAIASYRELVARFRKTLGENHPDTVTITNNFAAVLLHDHQYVEAERLLRDVLARTGADNGQGIDATAAENLATVLCVQARCAEAVEWARKAVALQASRAGASANLAIALRSLALAEEMAGDVTAAESDLRASVALGDYISATHGVNRFNWHLAWADFLVGQHRCAEAAPSIELSLAELTNSGDSNAVSKTEAIFLKNLCESEIDATNADATKSVAVALTKLRTIPGADIDA